MKRKVISIDTERCNGCGLCIPNCPEGALQIIDGKARLISDLFCDGLGACIGYCPENAIFVEEREAEVYDEKRVMENIVPAGRNTIIAHLKHLEGHGESGYLNTALEVLREKGISVVESEYRKVLRNPDSCPGSKMRDFRERVKPAEVSTEDRSVNEPVSELRQWPVQLQLLNPNAPYLMGADLVVAADCVPFAYPDFHRKILRGHAVAIFCPKLDATMNEYVTKLAEIFRTQGIRSVSVVHMEVPCCFGVGRVVEMAMKQAGVNIPIKDVTVTIEGGRIL
jgi:NAD-dependent dihydropyrimidine dehydrogenase PreA subunit